MAGRKAAAAPGAVIVRSGRDAEGAGASSGLSIAVLLRFCRSLIPITLSPITGHGLIVNGVHEAVVRFS